MAFRDIRASGVQPVIVGTDASHLITLEARPDLPAGEIPLTLTRIYADAGSTVTMGLTQVPAFANRSCRAVFSGQLVKQ